MTNISCMFKTKTNSKLMGTSRFYSLVLTTGIKGKNFDSHPKMRVCWKMGRILPCHRPPTTPNVLLQGFLACSYHDTHSILCIGLKVPIPTNSDCVFVHLTQPNVVLKRSFLSDWSNPRNVCLFHSTLGVILKWCICCDGNVWELLTMVPTWTVFLWFTIDMIYFT